MPAAISAREPSGQEDKSDVIREAVQNLPLPQRAVLILFHLDGFRLGEIAEILNIPEGTVKSRLFHARATLKEIMERSEA